MKGSPPFECDHIWKRGWTRCHWAGEGRFWQRGQEGVHFAFGLTFVKWADLGQAEGCVLGVATSTAG